MSKAVKIEIVDGRDYVSTNDAKRILGAASAADLRALGTSTITIGKRKTLWSLDWIINRAGRLQDSSKYKPDMKWIQEYESQRSMKSDKSTEAKKLDAQPGTHDSNTSTPSRLEDLKRLMPPPDQVPCNDVDWDAVEAAVGLPYPESFKEFVAVYGGLEWFDWLQPLIPCGDTVSPNQFRNRLDQLFRDYLGREILDDKRNKLPVPKFGSSGGWLPFMLGSDGDLYAWITDGPPAHWKVVSVVNRKARLLLPISITEMLVGWLRGEPTMEPVWGNVNEFRKHSPERLSMLR